MTLAEAINVLENTEFQGADPEVLQALVVLLQAAKTRNRGTEQVDVGSRVVETSTD